MKIYLLKCIGISMNKAPTLTSLCFIGLKSQLLRRWSNIPLLQYFLLSTNAISLSPPYLGAWCLRSYSKGNNVCGIGEGRAVRSLACDVCGEVICHYNACGCHGELLLISSNCSFFQAGKYILEKQQLVTQVWIFWFFSNTHGLNSVHWSLNIPRVLN